MAKSDLPLTEIISELDNSAKSIKSKALETLVLRLIQLLDLRFVEWRLRPQQTDGVEIAVLAESNHLIFSRWQIRCKNTAVVTLEDVATEVGLTFYLKSNVIMTVTTGKFSNAVRDYAKSIRQATSPYLILIDGQDLQALSIQSTTINAILEREIKHTKALKD